MEKVQKRQIEWFLTLANMNFEIEYFEPMIDLIHMMQNSFGKSIHPILRSIVSEAWNTERARMEMLHNEEKLKDLQYKTKEFIEGIISKYSEAQKYKKDEKKFLYVNGFKDIIDFRTLYQLEIKADIKIMIKNRPELEPIRNISEAGKKIGTKQWRASWTGDTLERSQIELDITPEESDDAFLFWFAQAINGIPLSSIKQCVECKNWFFQSGNRKRFFCVARCRSRNFNRENRKRIKENGGEEYEAQKKRGRARAKASYDRKIKNEVSKGAVVGKKV